MVDSMLAISALFSVLVNDEVDFLRGIHAQYDGAGSPPPPLRFFDSGPQERVSPDAEEPRVYVGAIIAPYVTLSVPVLMDMLALYGQAATVELPPSSPRSSNQHWQIRLQSGYEHTLWVVGTDGNVAKQAGLSVLKSVIALAVIY